MRNNLFLGVAAIALVAPIAAHAQETTTVIRGVVTNGGAPVVGASVVATETSSGTRYQTSTGNDGGYSLPGLRPGGPYTVQITSAQGSRTITDVYTVIQQAYNLPVEFADNAAAPGAEATTADVVVTASRVRGAGTSSDGPQTVLTQADVRKVASVNRDIRDIERRDPFATLDLTNSRAVSFAGVNPRFNRFTINGVQVGDQFGLNPDASPTRRGPIPFDAIGQVSVSIAPYDFRQGGFQGGAIDTVLLAGTNDFHGTGFYSQSTDGLQGDRIGSTTVVLPKYKSETYGATFRGPLIKDKLFFMVSAERNTDPRPLIPTMASQVPGLTDAKLAAVTGPAQSIYGYDPGGIIPITQNLDEKIVGRIDWNVTDRQKLSLSYINAFDQQDSNQNTSVSTTSPSIGLRSDGYRLTELLRAGIAQLNSDWTDNFSTEGRFIYRSNRRGQDSLLGLGFAQFRVCTDPTSVGTVTACTSGSTAAGTIGSPVVAYGPDISRQTNTLFTDTWGGSLLTRLRMNNHELKLLADFSRNRTTNNFLQYSAGGYYFDSLADYNNRMANQLIVAQPLNGQPNGAQADFRYDQWVFGIQDDWKVTDSFTLSYGIRYDLYAQEGAPVLNPYFLSRYNFPNTKTYKGLDNFAPRISFNWRPAGRLKVRGGFGVFDGGSPDIYLSNSFSNTILSNRVTFTRAATAAAGCTASIGTPTAAICAAALNNVNGKQINPLVAAYVTQPNATIQQGSITGALAPNFKLPSVYKATLSADYKFFGINFGADYLFTRTRQGLLFTDYRSQVIGTLPDGRPRYNGAISFADTNYDIVLGNTTKGRSHVADVRFNKDFDWGLSLGGSYTYQNVKDVAAATSSTISSLYLNQAYADPNSAAYGTSNDQTKWAFKYSVGYDHAFFGDYRTIFQLFGETRAGRPYSYTMNDPNTTRSPVFGTINFSNTNRYLLYVPTGTSDPLVSYDSATTQNALDTLINNTRLKDYRGRVSAKNIARSRAFTRIDLHLEQEIPTFIGKSRVSVFADIENLPNLINHNWGGLRQVVFPYTATTVNVQCLTTAVATGTTPTAAQINTASTQTCAQYRYTTANTPQELLPTDISNALYSIRIGARFTF